MIYKEITFKYIFSYGRIRLYHIKYKAKFKICFVVVFIKCKKNNIYNIFLKGVYVCERLQVQVLACLPFVIYYLIPMLIARQPLCIRNLQCHSIYLNFHSEQIYKEYKELFFISVTNGRHMRHDLHIIFNNNIQLQYTLLYYKINPNEENVHIIFSMTHI